MIEENRIRLLEEQVIRLTRENKAMTKIYNEKLKPMYDAVIWYNTIKEDELVNVGVAYHG